MLRRLLEQVQVHPKQKYQGLWNNTISCAKKYVFMLLNLIKSLMAQSTGWDNE